jgi:hypothetical protein
MGRPAFELVLAFVAIVVISLAYGLVAQAGIPQPYSLVGYCLGIAGFLMMLSTETMYSLRKRLQRFHFGPMSVWLQLHIVTGLVGPYLVLLHAGWKFNGLAGVLTLVTGIVVLSGVVGRYIYTAVPRNLEGTELAVAELEDDIAQADRHLQQCGVDAALLAVAAEAPAKGWFLVLARPLVRWRARQQLRLAISKLDGEAQAKARALETVLLKRQRLLRDIQSLETTRRLLALWHLFHIPLSAGLFALAFFHIGGAVYYATLSR